MAKDNEIGAGSRIKPAEPLPPPPDPLRDFKAADAFMTEILSFQLRLWQSWFVTFMTPHRIEILPLAGASQHDLPTRARSSAAAQTRPDKHKADRRK